MDRYTFIPYKNGSLGLPWCCVLCKNSRDAIVKAKEFKDKFNFDAVTIYKYKDRFNYVSYIY